MKKVSLLSFLGIWSMISFSQIKLHQNGTVAIGSIDSPKKDVELRGEILFSNAFSTISSAPLIKGGNNYSTSTAPSYTFFNNENTGWYHPAQHRLGLSINGVSKVIFNTAGAVFTDDFSTVNSGASAALIQSKHGYTTASTPDYSWYNNDNTGMYHPAIHQLGFTVGGSSRLVMNSHGNLFTDDASQLNSGGSAALIRSKHTYSTESTPDYSWYNNDNTGIYHPALHRLGFTVNGSSRLIMNNLGNVFTDNTAQLSSGGGSAALIRSKHSYSTASTPDYSWYDNDNTGMYHPEHNKICFSIDGNDALCMKWDWNSGLNANWHASTHQGILRVKRGDRLSSSSSEYFDLLYDPALEAGIINSGSGEVRFYNHLEETYNDLYFGEAFQLSDRNHKKNIKKIDRQEAQKIYQLGAKSFKYKKDTTSSSEHFGLIAQELELVYPHLVKTNSKGEKAVNYVALIPLLIEAVKEQQQEIATLSAQMNQCCSASKGNAKSKRMAQPTEGEVDQEASVQAVLQQNVPNPFKENTSISYSLPEENFQQAELYILNMSGVLLQTHAIKEPGEGTLLIEGRTLKAGMYLYSLYLNGNEVDTKKMILTR